MREELVCKKHVRGGHKVTATKMDARVEELLFRPSSIDTTLNEPERETDSNQHSKQ